MLPKLTTPLMSSMMLMGAGASGVGGMDFPLSIPGLSEWFDYRTVGGVGDGNPVGVLAGRKGLFDLSQTGTARPTYAADAGDGRAAIQFDGVDDNLSSTLVPSTDVFSTAKGEIWLVANPRSTTGIQGLSLVGTGTANGIALLYLLGVLYFDCPNNGADRSTVFAPAGWVDNWHVLRMVWNGTNRQLWVDGVELINSTKGATGTPTGDIVFVMGQAPGDGISQSDFRHMMMFNDELDPTTAGLLYDYLTTA